MVSAIRLGADTQIHTQMPAGLNISAHQEKQEEEKGEEKEEKGGDGEEVKEENSGNYLVHSCTIFLCCLDCEINQMIRTEIQI